MKRTLALTGFGVAAVLALAGCTGGDAGDDGDGPVELTFWHGYTEADGDVLQQIVDDFNASQDDVEITTEVKTEDGRVGILLSPPMYRYEPVDCVLAVVEPGETNVWMPSRIQRMPGEGGCSVGNALHPLPPPH